MKKDLSDALAQRPVIAAAIAEAREKGDLSENAEYDAARDAQGLLEVKIANLKNKIANAKVIDESKLNTDRIGLMSKLKVMNLSAKREMTFTIVGETEADFSQGKLAATTPIGKALYAFLDISPLTKGHTLVIPRKVEDDYIFHLDEQTYAGLWAFARKVAQAIGNAIPCKRVGVAVLGMEVPHTHIHLVPLQNEGDLDFRKEHLTLTPEEFKETAELINAEFRKL